MRKDIANFAKTCQQCANAKVLQHNTTSLSPVLLPPKRFTHVYVDLKGPLNESCGYRYLMVIVDRFFRFIPSCRQIKHSTVAYIQARGLDERLNRSLQVSLRAYEESSQ